jgi:hypothetical protein
LAAPRRLHHVILPEANQHDPGSRATQFHFVRTMDEGCSTWARADPAKRKPRRTPARTTPAIIRRSAIRHVTVSA